MLGQILRRFVNITCKAFRTQELPRETAARGRRKAAIAAKTGKPPPSTTKKAKARQKYFNLSTYKLHALGDYAKTIRLFGTTDNYSTQVVRFTHSYFHLFKNELNDQGELEHRRIKRFYPRTNKVGYPQQIAKHQRRERLLYNLSKSSTPENNPTATVSFQESDPLPYTPPTVHHHISNSNRHHINLTAWLGTHSGDPALIVCYPFDCSLSVPENV
jgi:hypothetical protein